MAEENVRIIDKDNMPPEFGQKLQELCTAVGYILYADQILILASGEYVKAAIGNMEYSTAFSLMDSAVAHTHKKDGDLN